MQKMTERSEIKERVMEMLRVVGLPDDFYGRYPFECSGGQRQRVGIARALIMKPELIVCDEAVSALDVSTQSQIINLLCDIQKQYNPTYLFISHGLSVVRHICSRVMVMYLGKVVELAECEELYKNPKHPYTQALFSAIPLPDPESKTERIMLEGDVPNPVDVPGGALSIPDADMYRRGAGRKFRLFMILEKDTEQRATGVINNFTFMQNLLYYNLRRKIFADVRITLQKYRMRVERWRRQL